MTLLHLVSLPVPFLALLLYHLTKTTTETLCPGTPDIDTSAGVLLPLSGCVLKTDPSSWNNIPKTRYRATLFLGLQNFLSSSTFFYIILSLPEPRAIFVLRGMGNNLNLQYMVSKHLDFLQSFPEKLFGKQSWGQGPLNFIILSWNEQK